MPAAHVIVIGGGLAGIAASVVLAERGLRVSLLEKHPRLGGRATSYLLPSGEYIDNCQHVTLRCCTNLEDFYRRLGVADKIKYYDRLSFADSKGHRGAIKPSLLPAPFHLAPSFATFPLLDWKDKRAITRAMLRIIRTQGQQRLSRDMTMLDWLKQNRQTQNAIHRFWRVVLVSALNEELDRTDAAYGIEVFWKAFLSNRDAFGMGIPAVPLETLYASAANVLEQSKGHVRTRCGAAELQISGGQVAGVRLDDGSMLNGDYYVAAIPFHRLTQLLPYHVRDSVEFASIQQLKVSPITSVHLWFDAPVMQEPFLTSVDQTIQWIFNKTALCSPGAAGQYLQVVISASYALGEQSQQDIINMCRKELADVIPASGQVKLMRAVVVRENAATFSPEPGCDRWRPGERTSIRNLFLAGDWIRTGWPATMESAIRSGYLAAEAILALEGKPVRLVRPELRASGLARWFASSM
jgi:squalene-associated FAD-dependent desaturase